MHSLGMSASWIWSSTFTRYESWTDLERVKVNGLQVYAILDEVFLAGEIEETSKQVVLTRLEHLDKLD
jgi:hypothetical protein